MHKPISSLLTLVFALSGCSRTTPPVTTPGPAQVTAALQAASRYFDQSDSGDALLILRQLIDKRPDVYEAHELLGQVLYTQAVEARQAGDVASAERLAGEASDAYAEAVRRAASEGPLIRAGLSQSAGEISSAAGRLEAALAHFDAAGAIDTTNSKHPLYAAQILLQLDRIDEAEQRLRRALSIDPSEPFAHASLAMVAIERGDCGVAIEHITRARAIDRTRFVLRLSEARVRRRCDQPEQALALLVAMSPTQRAEEGVAEEIALCHRALGSPGLAAEAWEHRYAVHPTDLRAAVRAVESHLEAGEVERAWALYGVLRLEAPADRGVLQLGRRLADVPR